MNESTNIDVSKYASQHKDNKTSTKPCAHANHRTDARARVPAGTYTYPRTPTYARSHEREQPKDKLALTHARTYTHI